MTMFNFQKYPALPTDAVPLHTKQGTVAWPLRVLSYLAGIAVLHILYVQMTEYNNSDGDADPFLLILQGCNVGALLLAVILIAARDGGVVYVYGDRIVAYRQTRPRIFSRTVMFADITSIEPAPAELYTTWAGAIFPIWPLHKLYGFWTTAFVNVGVEGHSLRPSVIFKRSFVVAGTRGVLMVCEDGKDVQGDLREKICAAYETYKAENGVSAPGAFGESQPLLVGR
ncbi:hypothetical protein DFJ77DRAFT_520463 [Powellomyces hirtus]|nr:hypothetical protein DFJ77DRAFT_520463 [Powellomyces hirtus]